MTRFRATLRHPWGAIETVELRVGSEALAYAEVRALRPASELLLVEAVAGGTVGVALREVLATERGRTV